MPEHLRDKLLKQDKKKSQNSKKEDNSDRKDENKSFSIIVRSRSRPMPILTTLATAALRTPSPSVQDIYLDTCSENHIVEDINLLQDVRSIIM
jgi:hypothetical protein